MPVQAADTEIVYTGNGSATVFAFPFKIQQAADFAALVGGAPVSAYSLTGINDDNGGTCTFDVAPANGAPIVLYRVVPYDRTLTDYQEVGEFAADTVDADVDRVVLQTQQIATTLKRVPKMPIGAPLTDYVFAPSPGGLLAWDLSGQNLVTVDPATLSPGTIVVTPYIQTLLDDATAAAARATLITSDLVTHVPVNVAIQAVRNGNDLEVSLTGLDGNAHAATNVGYVPVRSATLSVSPLQQLAITSPPPVLTIPSGATLGATVSLDPFRIWVGLFIDGSGDPVLGVIQNVSLAGDRVLSVRGFDPTGFVSTTLLQASSGTFATWYTNPGIGARAYAVLGYIEYSSGLATPGVYSANPTKLQTIYPGMAMPGELVRVAQGVIDTYASGTTTNSIDDNVPDAATWGNATGLQLSAPVQSSANVHDVELIANVAHSAANGDVFGILTQGGTTLETAFSSRYGAVNGRHAMVMRALKRASGSNYIFRIGSSTAGTTSINGSGGGRHFGGSAVSKIIAREIAT